MVFRAVVNIGTSAQLATLLSAEEVATITHATKSFEVRPFVVNTQFIGVAAALSGCVHCTTYYTDLSMAIQFRSLACAIVVVIT